MKKVNLPYDEHAMSRYAAITTDAIHKIQEDYFRSFGRWVGLCWKRL